MKKYEVKKDSIEVSYKNRKQIKQGVVLSVNDSNPEVIFSCEELEDARRKLKDCKSSIVELSSGVGKYYLVEEFYIEENIYDEDGDWVESGDILEFSKISIELVEKPSYETIAIFDNMADAEDAKDNYDGDGEVYLSF